MVAEQRQAVEPKVSLAFGPWNDTGFFLAAGRGFHSNVARRATITVYPVDGLPPVDSVTALAKTKGSEGGTRTTLIPNCQLSLSVSQLDLDSELLFVDFLAGRCGIAIRDSSVMSAAATICRILESIAPH